MLEENATVTWDAFMLGDTSLTHFPIRHAVRKE